MAYAFVGAKSNTSNGNSITYSPSAGNLLAVFTFTSTGAGSPTASITDNLSSTWSTAQATSNLTGPNGWQSSFYLANCPAGITSVTVTFNGGTPGQNDMMIVEYSGIATTTPFIVGARVHQATPGTGTDLVSSGNGNVTSQPAAVIGISCNGQGNAGYSGGTGFTARTSTGSNWMKVEDQRVTSTGNIAATFTSTRGALDDFMTVMLAFSEPVAAVPLVQSSTGNNSATNTTMTATLNGVTGGNLLVCTTHVQSSSSTATTTPSDSGGNTYQNALLKGPQGTGTGIFTGIWHISNAAAGTHTVTVTIPATARPSFVTLAEYSGMAVFAPFDVQASAGHDDSTQSVAVTTGATGQSAEVIIGAVSLCSSVGSASAAITDPPAGYTTVAVNQNDTNATNIGAEVCYKVVAGTGAQSATWTWTDVNTIGSAGGIATYRTNAPVATWVFYRPAIQFVDESVIQH